MLGRTRFCPETQVRVLLLQLRGEPRSGLKHQMAERRAPSEWNFRRRRRAELTKKGNMPLRGPRR